MQAILKQFDLPKKKSKDVPATDLEMLAGDIENEEATTRRDFEGGQDDKDDGKFDPCAGMDVKDEEDLDDDLQPVRMVLVKVTITCSIGCVPLLTAAQLHHLSYAIKNSTTCNLPQWFEILEDLKLSKWMIPRDVATRWNSTFDMLKFAVKFRPAIDEITAEHEMKLWEYELMEREWTIVGQLHDVLKVC